MARHRTHEKSVRTRMLTVRLTPEDHQRLVEAAATGGTTVSGVAERLIVTGRINVAATEQLDPKVMAELGRIGNNLNQIAHAVNSNLPPVISDAARQLHDLAVILYRNELFARRRAAALEPGETSNDSEAPSARDEFQRSVAIRSP